MRRIIRFTVFLLILCLVLSFCYAAVESAHECSEADCPICKVIAVLSLLFITIILPILLSVSFGYRITREDTYSDKSFGDCSLVGLKVKLSD